MVNFSYALNYAVSGTGVWSYHALNIAIHAGTALVLLGILRRTLASPACRDFIGPVPYWIPPLAALLWALHPLQTETVVGIAQRTESLCGLFYLLTLYGFIRGTEPSDSTLPPDAKDSLRPPAMGRWLVLSTAACLAGMGTKEVMVTAPVVVLLYDRTFVAGTFSAAWQKRRAYYLGLAVTWLLLAWLVWHGKGARGASAGFGLGVSAWSYLLTQCEAIPLYLKLSLWPHPLVLDYGTALVRALSEVWWQATGVIALLAGTLWALIRKPVLGFAGAWFFLILAPSSSVIPLVTQTIAEHRMYLPLLSVVVLIVVALHRAMGARARWLLGGVAVVFAGATLARNHDYRGPIEIWTTNVIDYPSSARGHNNLAVAFQQIGRMDSANEHFARAVALAPDYVAAHFNWGAALLAQQRPAEALPHLETAVRLAPNHADAHLDLGKALFHAGRTPEAIREFETALKLRPAADAHFNLGVVLATTSNNNAAIEHFEAALQLQPAFPAAAFALGNLLAHAQRFDEAVAAYRLTLKSDPGYLPALANLGNALLASGRVAEAISTYEAALRLHPDDTRLRENLAVARSAPAAR